MIQGTSDVSELLEWFAKASHKNRVEGLTISGGEPMEQAPAVLELLRRLREAHPEMTTGLFSGYTERELPESLWRAMQSYLDFAVLGRYNARRPSHHPLVSSTNQLLRLYTARYSMADFAAQSVEVHIDNTGLTQITGFPMFGSPVLG